MTVVLLGVAILGVGLAAFWYYGSKPARHRHLTSERVAALVEILLRRGLPGAALFVEEKGGARFVQVTKYVGDGDHWGIQSDFPLTRWSEPFYHRVPECVTDLGLRAREMTTGREDTRGFLTVDLGRNVASATRLKSPASSSASSA